MPIRQDSNKLTIAEARAMIAPVRMLLTGIATEVEELEALVPAAMRLQRSKELQEAAAEFEAAQRVLTEQVLPHLRRATAITVVLNAANKGILSSEEAGRLLERIQRGDGSVLECIREVMENRQNGEGKMANINETENELAEVFFAEILNRNRKGESMDRITESELLTDAEAQAVWKEAQRFFYSLLGVDAEDEQVEKPVQIVEDSELAEDEISEGYSLAAEIFSEAMGVTIGDREGDNNDNDGDN